MAGGVATRSSPRTVTPVRDAEHWHRLAVLWAPRLHAEALPAADDRREQVIAAAIEAILEIGPDVGMAQIASRAGVQRPNMYRLFAGKEELDVAVAVVASADLVDQVRAVFAEPGTPRTLVARLTEVSVAWAADHPNLYRFLASRPQTRALQRTRLSRERFLRDLVVALVAHLEVPIGPPEGVVSSLVGMVDASILWWLDHDDESQEQLATRLARHVLVVLADVSGGSVDVVPDALLGPVAPSPRDPGDSGEGQLGLLGGEQDGSEQAGTVAEVTGPHGGLGDVVEGVAAQADPR